MIGAAVGVGVVLLGHVMGPAWPIGALVLAAALIVGLLLFLVHPRAVLVAYLFLLPLAMPYPLGIGLNLGEVLTLGLLVLGVGGLWHGRERLPAALRALTPMLLPLAGFVVVSMASTLVNDVDTFEGIAAAVFKGVAFGVVAVLVHVYADSRAAGMALLRAILLGGAAVAFYSIVSYLAGWSYSETYGYNRAVGTFSTWNHLGGFMALVSVPTVAYAWTTRRPVLRSFLLLAFVAELLAILLALTLGSVVALLLAAGVAATFLFKVNWRRVGPGVLLALGAFATVWFTNPLLRDKFGHLDDRLIDRFRTYEVGISMFRDQFWFGFGSPERVESILRLTSRYAMTTFGETSTVPHNALLLMGVEKGVFGLIFFALVVAGSLWLVVREKKSFRGTSLEVVHQGITVGVLAFLIQSMGNNLVVHARLGILYFALVALAVRFREEAAIEMKSPLPRSAPGRDA